MNPILTHGPSSPVDAVRRAVLEFIGREGPAPLAAMPARWPLTRQHLRRTASALIRDGLLDARRVARTGATVLSLTPRGQAELGANGRQPEAR